MGDPGGHRLWPQILAQVPLQQADRLRQRGEGRCALPEPRRVLEDAGPAGADVDLHVELTGPDDLRGRGRDALLDGERLYCAWWDGSGVSLAAYDLTGKELWQESLGGYVSQHGPGFSPMVYDGTVFVIHARPLTAAEKRRQRRGRK